MAIYFYSTKGSYGCFSNFSLDGFTSDGLYWPTAEHYFQAMKFADPAHRERIANAKTPKQAKLLGWDRSLPIRADWDIYRDEVMRKAVLLKFQTHPEIAEVLLATGDEELVENSPIDYYWGCGKDGSGKNMLGRVLMEVRESLRNGA